MAQTKYTLREILQRLQDIGLERPEDQPMIMDVVSIINNHVQVLQQLRKVEGKNSRTETIASVDQVLYD